MMLRTSWAGQLMLGQRTAAAPSSRTSAAPQEGQRHLCLPADVFPFLFIFDPQDGHLTDFTANLQQTVLKR